MNQRTSKRLNLARRKFRIRKTVTGTTERPRLSVFISNKHMSAQIIDDVKHHTVASATTVGKASKPAGTMTEMAESVGASIAKQAKKAGVKKVVFDRNGRMYHGKIKALADAARKEGLEF